MPTSAGLTDNLDAAEASLNPQTLVTFPLASSTTKLSSPMVIARGTSRDFGNRRVVGRDGGQSEGQSPLLVLEDGASVSNLILGFPADDGIHCKGTCTLTNVW